jgi:hypothetical protein
MANAAEQESCLSLRLIERTVKAKREMCKNRQLIDEFWPVLSGCCICPNRSFHASVKYRVQY